jgi:hypothetical protein
MLLEFLLDETLVAACLQITFFIAIGLSIAGGVIEDYACEKNTIVSIGLLVWGLCGLGLYLIIILLELIMFLYPFFTLNHIGRFVYTFHVLKIVFIVMLFFWNLTFFVLGSTVLDNVVPRISSDDGARVISNITCGTIRDICLIVDVYLGFLSFGSIITITYGAWCGKLSRWFSN